jgi:hypothetical protein
MKIKNRKIILKDGKTKNLVTAQSTQNQVDDVDFDVTGNCNY